MSAVSTSRPVVAAQAALPEPRAARLQRPSWRDTRLLVGVLLVAAAVAIGARVVAAADDTVGVYAATATLPAGSDVRADDLRVVRVRLGSGTAGYLSAAAALPSRAVLLRTVGAGELVPSSAVGDAAALERRPVSIPVEGASPAGLAPGSLVDVWVSARERQRSSSGYRPPERLAERAEVLEVSTGEGGFDRQQPGHRAGPARA